MINAKLSMSIIRWTARISGTGIFLFWGDFPERTREFMENFNPFAEGS